MFENIELWCHEWMTLKGEECKIIDFMYLNLDEAGHLR